MQLNQMYVETLQQAVDGVVLIDKNNHILFFNHSAEILWGYFASEVIGHNVSLLVPDAIKGQHDNFIRSNRETGVNKIVGTTRDVKIQRKDGNVRWGSMSISRINMDGQILYTAFIKDVTVEHEKRELLNMLSLATDNTDSVIIITDSRCRIIYANRCLESTLGYSLDTAIAKHLYDLLTPILANTTIDSIRQELQSGLPVKFDALIQSSQQNRLWCNISMTPVLNTKGEMENVVSILSEITTPKLHEVLQHKLLGAMAREEPLSQVMHTACEELELMDSGLNTAIMKVEAGHYMQLLAAPNLPKSLAARLRHLETKEVVSPSAKVVTCGEKVWVSDIETDPLWEGFRQEALSYGYKSSWSVPIKDTDQKVVGVISFYFKNKRMPETLHHSLLNAILPLCALAFEKEKNRENIRNLAYYDSLTKIPNRSLLLAQSENILIGARNSSTVFAVLFLDIDGFKQVNDTLGHIAGDGLLRFVADTLNEVSAPSDLVGRLSGDEFVVVKPMKAPEELQDFIDKIRSRLSQPVILETSSVHPSVSMGISLFPDDGEDIATLIHHADMAMYEAKKECKGQFAFFSHELNQLARERQAIEADLKTAINGSALLLHYQPKISMTTKHLVGVEALARWNHYEKGCIPPSFFIPLAEECGLILPFSLWLVRAVCRQIYDWRNQDIDVNNVAINLSADCFKNGEVLDVLITNVNMYRIQPEQITIEITESVFLEPNNDTLEVLNRASDFGFRLSLDDFGTGYSSLSCLHRIPIHEIKLDKGFVSELRDSLKIRSLCDAIIKMARSLSLDVVAEGIENEQQENILRQQGYDVAQGFYYSKPLSPKLLESWLLNAKSK